MDLLIDRLVALTSHQRNITPSDATAKALATPATGRDANTCGRLTEAAYDFLKERLLEVRYSPGERIALNAVAEAIGASL